MGLGPLTTVKSTSWFGRMGSSVRGVGFGVLLFVVSFPLVWWNEGRAVKTAKGLEEGAAAIVSIEPDDVAPENDGRLVHLSGEARTDDVLTDPDFDVSVNALKLARQSEMYQWQENTSTTERKKLGGGTEQVTTYTYEKTWWDSPIDSQSFQQPGEHQNPRNMLYESKEWVAADVSLGAFTLTSGQVGRIAADENLPVNGDDSTEEPVAAEASLENPDAGTNASSNGVARRGNTIYVGRDPNNPEIGDVRLSYTVARPQNVSIIAKQTGNSFAPFETSQGVDLDMFYAGAHSAEEMFRSEHQKNTAILWGIRVVGFVMMFLGLRAVFGPLGVMGDVLPFFGAIVRVGTGIIAFVLAIVFTMLTVGLAWLFYRPLIGIALLLVSAFAVAMAIVSLKKGKQHAAASPGPPPGA